MWYSLIIIIFLIVMEVVKCFLRKYLSVERKPHFSFNHVNDVHRAVDWTMRIFTSGITICLFWFLFMIDFDDISFGLMPVLAMYFISLTLIDAVRAVFEWKSSSEPKQAIITIVQASLFLVFILVFFYWGLRDLDLSLGFYPF